MITDRFTVQHHPGAKHRLADFECGDGGNRSLNLKTAAIPKRFSPRIFLARGIAVFDHRTRVNEGRNRQRNQPRHRHLAIELRRGLVHRTLANFPSAVQ